jgi:hypothetical protein
MKKVEVKPEEKSEQPDETLEQITREWIKQQKNKFVNPTVISQEKRFSNMFSVVYVLKLFKNAMCKKRRLDDILYIFRLYIPNITELLKKMWNDFVRSIESMLKIERW